MNAVTIDPENRDEIGRLIAALPDAEDWLFVREGEVNEQVVDAFQAALREFANPTPPKPDEPTGLGAVVETSQGALYVRVAGDGEPWIASDASDWCYPELDVVKVLSEGVTA